MSSPSRTALVQSVQALRAASLEPAVRASDPAGEILRRGIAVSAYNLLEAFIEGRIGELAMFVNQGHIHFVDLPERVQTMATRHVIEVANARVRRMPTSDVPGFLETVGRSLSAVNGPINLSALTWLWTGSNMGAQDYALALKLFHVDKPWQEIADLAPRLGLPAGSPELDLKEFGKSRNSAAHDSSHPVSNLWIPFAIDLVVKFAVSFDAFASVGSFALRSGDLAYLNNTNWTSGVVGIRRIVERKGDWAEYTENGARAFRTGANGHSVILDAATRCGPCDLLTVTDLGGQLIDWSVPVVG